MGFEEQYKKYSGATEAPTSNFDEMYKQASTGQPVSPKVVRPLQRKPAPLKDISADIQERENLGLRGLKGFANVLPETAKSVIGGGGIPGAVLRWHMAGKLQKSFKDAGVKVPSKRELRKLLKQRTMEATKIPEFKIAPAETIAEKAVDIAAGIGKFMAKLAILKKVFPTASGGALWEMENLSSGGTPGMGYAMHGVFSAPGKVIKGTGIGAKAGKLGLESAGLAGVTALETKIDTGEIDWKAVGVSAALPVALRTPGAIKKLIKAKHPKTLRAVVKASEESTIKRLKPDELKHYKVLKEGIKDDKVLNLLATKYPKLLELPNEIRFSSSISASGMFEHGTKTLILNPNYITSPQKAAKHLIHELVHAYQLKRGNFPKLWDEVLKTYGLQGKSTAFIQKKLRSLSPEEYKKLPTEQMSYRLEELIGQKIRSLKAKPITFESTNKAVEAQIAKAKVINVTERKASVKALHKRQSARYAAKKRELRLQGLSRKEAHEIAKKERAGKAAVPEMEPLILTPEQRAVYDARIDKAYPLGPKSLTHANAMDVLTKLENGQIPTNYEFGLLEPVIGRGTLMKIHKALVPHKKLEFWDIPTLARDIPKAIRFGFDPQAARGLSKITIRHPLIYLSSLGKNIRGIFSKKFADKIGTQIESSPIYKLGKEAYKTNYLSMKPWASVEAGTKLEQYGHISEIFLRSNSKILKGIGTWLRASERGANLGMNSALNKLVVKGEKDLARYGKSKNLTQADKAAWRKRRGHDINIYTKRITARHPKGKAIQRAANWLVFSPAYAASGLVSGPNSFMKLATGKGFADKTYAMQIMLSRLAGLTAVSAGVGYAGYKYRVKNPTEEPLIDSSPNPVDPLFGKIRQGDEVYDLGFGDIADYRLMARIGLSAHMATKEAVTGKQVTTTIGGKKIPTAGESFGIFMESKRTLILSLAKQLASGKDWMGRPVTLKETFLDNLPFEFFQAFVEAGEADGLWEDMADGLELDNAKKALGNLAPSIAALGGFGTGSYPVHASVTRSKFRNMIAKDNYGKVWDELSVSEQGRLRSDHRKQFDFLAEKIRKERAVDPPFSRERSDKEEREAKQRVTKMLSVKSRKLTKDIKLNLNRRPKDFYLNDDRYNRYQELTAQFIEEKLSAIDFSNVEDIRRVKRVQLIVKAAKSRAFMTVRREMNGR